MIQQGASRPRVERAVWSLWSRPYGSFYHSSWVDDLFHLLSWVLSYRLAASHFRSTALVTDTAGAALLIEGLGLPFGDVSTSLDLIPAGVQEHCWALGKLYAYRQQSEPFLHLDSDVYLWKPLPERLLHAEVFVQNPEFAPSSDASYYKPTALIKRARESAAWLPEELVGYVSSGGETAFCTGMVGGVAVGHLNEYADRAARLCEDPRNYALWESAEQARQDMVLVEQFYLAAYCMDTTNRLARRPGVEYLFRSQAQSFDESAARSAGYTHLIAGSKRDLHLRGLVLDRVRKEYPEDYTRCVALAASSPRVAAPVEMAISLL